MKIEYRIKITENGNENMHIIRLKAQSDSGAQRSLARELAKYGGDGYGWIEHRGIEENKDMWRTLEN